MRYYNIVLTNPTTGQVFRSYTSYVNGADDPGAMNVVIDALGAPFSQGQVYASVQIWGVPLTDLSKASDFTNMTIVVYAGFQAGLPLNKPQQAGVIISGYVWQAFGNWLGTDMTLDFVIVNGGGLTSEPANIQLQWQAGQPLATALANTLSTAFPTMKQEIAISPQLVVNYAQTGVYQTMTQFCQDLKSITQAALGGTYQGVDIVLQNGTFIAYDGSTPKTPIMISFQDLIGQPTYIGASTMQFVCPMRADIGINDYVQMPSGYLNQPGFVQTSTASQPQANQQSVFQGVYVVNSVHHMGQFRVPDGQAWVTVFECAFQPSSAS